MMDYTLQNTGATRSSMDIDSETGGIGRWREEIEPPEYHV